MATGLAAGLVGVGPSAATPAARADASVPAAASAAWLEGLLGPDAVIVDPALGVEDVDATLDVLLGLVASGTTGTASDAVADRLTADVAVHTGIELDATFVAVTAKLALVLPAAGRDPRDVGGRDLVALLAGRVGADGRARDRSGLGDLSTPRSQALTVLALSRAGADPAVLLRSADALAAAACPDGGLPAEFGPATCTTDPVATALAAAALAATAGGVGADAALAAARDEALTVLLALDAAGDLDPWAAGITATALRATGRTGEADAIADRLMSRLDGCDAGATAALLDEDPLRATVGALLAASGATLTDLSPAADGPAVAALDCDAAAPSAGAGGGTDGGATDRSDEAAGTGEGSPDVDDADAGGLGRFLSPALVAGVVVVLVLLAGLPLLRSARRD